MNRLRFFVNSILLLTLLAGCVMPIDPSATTRAPIAPEAANWQTWVLSSSAELRPAAPPDATATAEELAALQAMATQRDANAAQVVAYWDTGSPSYRWLEEAVNRYRLGPPTPAVTRALALLNVAIYDATIATWDAKYAYNRPHPRGIETMLAVPNSPSYPSEHAAAAGAASTILAYFFPDEADTFAAQAKEAAQSRLLAGVNYPSDVDAGLALGRAVGEKVIEWASADGYAETWTGEVPTGPGKWVGQNPVTPLAGTWRTWVIASPADYLPPPPPAYDSEQMQLELTEIKTITRTFPLASKAMMWNSFDSGAHPYWYRFIATRLFEQRMDHNAPYAALLYAAAAVVFHDSSVACFNGKYTYWQIRPPQLEPAVTPLFPVPNHPSYPAAHACLSYASAIVMGNFFPNDAEMLLAAGKEAGESRIWAGIHYRSDVDAGLILAEGVAEAVLARVKAMTGE